MTLRVNINIVPFGDEDREEGIFRIDISNTGLVRDEGLGNEICSYDAIIYKHNNETIQRLCKQPEWEKQGEYSIKEHNRRDGSLTLAKKAIDAFEEEWS